MSSEPSRENDTESSTTEELTTEQVVSEPVESETPESAAPMFTAEPLNGHKIQNILEAALMAAGQPLSIDRMLTLFLDTDQPSREEIREALTTLTEACENRGIELVEVGSGFRYQAKQDNAEWVARLWEEKPARYSRALLETLALIAYRQPITRGEIEDIRGVSVSTNIMRTLTERDWVKVVGHRDVPGKPAMYASTKQFLDYFSLKSLSDMPSLAEIRDIDSINAELDLAEPNSDKKMDAADGDVQLDLAANDSVESDDVAEEQSTDTMVVDMSAAATDDDSDSEGAIESAVEDADTESAMPEHAMAEEGAASAVDPA